MAHEVHVMSHFSLPTDLALVMSQWPEFHSGAEYTADLFSLDGTEQVTVRLIENDEERYVAIRSDRGTSLFFRVLGAVIYALGKDSDNLMVVRWG
jgi:hypothetical protein